MKQKEEITVRLDRSLLDKAEALAEIEGQSLNNMIVSLVRQNIAYHERVHGKITVKKQPENTEERTN